MKLKITVNPKSEVKKKIQYEDLPANSVFTCEGFTFLKPSYGNPIYLINDRDEIITEASRHSWAVDSFIGILTGITVDEVDL